MEYKIRILIGRVLKEKLESDKTLLASQQKDTDCPEQIYQNTLTRCIDLEYAIKQMEKLI